MRNGFFCLSPVERGEVHGASLRHWMFCGVVGRNNVRTIVFGHYWKTKKTPRTPDCQGAISIYVHGHPFGYGEALFVTERAALWARVDNKEREEKLLC
jgi:hypothetical protein